MELIAIPGLPLIRSGEDLSALVVGHAQTAGIEIRSHDVLVFAQKIVSKAEGRVVRLADVVPSPRAIELATVVLKDPRMVELVLRESVRVVRAAPNVLIVEHRLGMVMANAGIDQSNVNDGAGSGLALLLPADPDGTAARLRADLLSRTGADVGIVINDSFGRAWRQGTVGVAIGAAGVASLLDLRGTPDLLGRALQSTVVGHADEIAAAASLVMGQSSESRPVVIVRGLSPPVLCLPAAALLRPHSEDLFQ
jgi:coenzyme F420-0:L-glutamate ligase / coenzyme F420-1:gamma-L-glutamate ligase